MPFTLRPLCRKCQYERFNVDWHAHCAGPNVPYATVAHEERREHLHYRCERCGYEFLILTFDA